jgi:hypothetical protein
MQGTALRNVARNPASMPIFYALPVFQTFSGGCEFVISA